VNKKEQPPTRRGNKHRTKQGDQIIPPRRRDSAILRIRWFYDKNDLLKAGVDWVADRYAYLLSSHEEIHGTTMVCGKLRDIEEICSYSFLVCGKINKVMIAGSHAAAGLQTLMEESVNAVVDEVMEPSREEAEEAQRKAAKKTRKTAIEAPMNEVVKKLKAVAKNEKRGPLGRLICVLIFFILCFTVVYYVARVFK
jgi:hypothetical protein